MGHALPRSAAFSVDHHAPPPPLSLPAGLGKNKHQPCRYDDGAPLLRRRSSTGKAVDLIGVVAAYNQLCSNSTLNYAVYTNVAHKGVNDWLVGEIRKVK